MLVSSGRSTHTDALICIQWALKKWVSMLTPFPNEWYDPNVKFSFFIFFWVIWTFNLPNIYAFGNQIQDCGCGSVTS